MAVHRLVTLSFIGLALNEFEVNHKNGNKRNNELSNLEYVSSSDNKKYGWQNGLYKITEGHNNQFEKAKDKANIIWNIPRRIPIEQLDLSGNLIAKYESITQAVKNTGIDHTTISRCIKGIRKTTHNFKWRKAT